MIRIISGTFAMFQLATLNGTYPDGVVYLLFVISAAITLYGIVSCNKNPTWY